MRGKKIRNPKYPWKPSYAWDHCPACFENWSLDKCDHCGSGHPDEYIDSFYKNQFIVCAATKLISTDGKEVILVGVRHWDKLMHEQFDNIDHGHLSLRDKSKDEQGFIDQFGDFVNREDAWKIAKANGQIKSRVSGDERINKTDGSVTFRLFSENLY